MPARLVADGESRPDDVESERDKGLLGELLYECEGSRGGGGVGIVSKIIDARDVPRLLLVEDPTTNRRLDTR